MGDVGDNSDVNIINSDGIPALPNRVLATFVTDNDITNTATETDLFSFSVPANMLSTDNVIRVTVFGTYAANSGSPTMIVKFYYGTTVMWSDVSFVISAVAGISGAWEFTAFLSAHNATNLQELAGKLNFGNRAAATTGVGDIGSTTSGPTHPIEGTSAENSTTTLTFKMTVTWSAANATYSFKRKFGLVELLAVS